MKNSNICGNCGQLEIKHPVLFNKGYGLKKCKKFKPQKYLTQKDMKALDTQNQARHLSKLAVQRDSSGENNQSQESRLVSTEKFSSFSNPGSNPGPDALRGIFSTADLEREILEEFRRRTQRKGFYLYKIGKSLVLSEEDFDVLLDIFKETSQRLKAEVEKILDEILDNFEKMRKEQNRKGVSQYGNGIGYGLGIAKDNFKELKKRLFGK